MKSIEETNTTDNITPDLKPLYYTYNIACDIYYIMDLPMLMEDIVGEE